MITLVHGGQTGVDRGAHEAAIDNGWHITGYMPRDQRDELGRIPPDVARFLVPHDKTIYAARTAANVRASTAVLIVVKDADDPRATPGTATTIDLAGDRHLRQMIVDPRTDASTIARWIWYDLLVVSGTLPLPLKTHDALALIPTKLLVAGPRESKWQGARVETAGLLRRVALALAEISRTPEPGQDLARKRR
jgi:Circularly permutated YpsA SLOG family